MRLASPGGTLVAAPVRWSPARGPSPRRLRTPADDSGVAARKPAVVQKRGGGYYKDDGPGDDDSRQPRPDSRRAAAARSAEPLRQPALRRLRQVLRAAIPASALSHQRGIASWYGKKFHGQNTSIGEPYDMFAMTAAHPTLAIPSYVRVTNLANGEVGRRARHRPRSFSCRPRHRSLLCRGLSSRLRRSRQRPGRSRFDRAGRRCRPEHHGRKELLDIFKAFTAIPILLEGERGYAFSADDLRREILGRGLSALLLSNPCNPTGKLIEGEELAKLGRHRARTGLHAAHRRVLLALHLRRGRPANCPWRRPRDTWRTSIAIPSCCSTG